MFLRQIVDEKLAQYAYLIGCQRTGQALIIDPERDIDRYVAAADAAGLRIVAVTETHIHADFLSGAREFAERYGTRVYLSDEGDADWKYEWAALSKYDCVLLHDGDTFRIGNIDVKAVHTPGHTPEHLVFLITDTGADATEPMGMASGDFVFVGDLGRPDLLESAAGLHGAMRPSAERLYGSVQRFLHLPDFLQVWPGHGAGSACGKALGAVPETTVGYEKRFSAAIKAARGGEEAFVDYILKDQPEPPLYFARMKRDNRKGPPILGDLPRPRRMDPRALVTALNGRGIVVDTRLDRAGFMSRHLRGSLYARFDRAFNTAVGSLLTDESTPLYLVIDDDHVEAAVRDLVRIGYDRIPGYADPGEFEAYLAQDGGSRTEQIEFADVEQLRARPDQQVLDVRNASEFQAGHVPGALNIAYTRLADRLAEVPRDKALLVYCLSGARAAVASAFLEANGWSVKYVGDNFGNYERIAAG
ncbi:MAG: MBL fold metallo-hydrolase [Acidobacteria bacterium RIFCSPLOWO2_02_FULL_67_36]|nr:MAG: MBL fold metallo-hydrolase [Acidobacteria bacterium RIFCSPLOWO2_02_FULL_67_36]OFW18333.1 MAG: MBL fold metallo-hydrolase [Acidobacteria bacterium RIFCSPLOWO2_12_FULL_66_21]